jgi:DNA-binding beta-propeller fold protein YncE
MHNHVCRTACFVAAGCAWFLTGGSAGCAQSRGVLFPALSQPRIWPAPPSKPRIRLVGEISDSSDLRAAVSAEENFAEVFRGRRPPIAFSAPHGVAVDEDRWLAVTDTSAAAVHIIDLLERTHTTVYGWESDRLQTPVGVAWMNGDVVIADAQRGELIRFSRTGEFLATHGSDDLVRPVGLAFAPSRGMLLAVDGGEHRVVVFDERGNLVRTFSGPGAATGLLNFPTHIGAAGELIFVADSGNFRLQVFDFDGGFVTSFGKKGDAAGDFALPKGVTVDRHGHVYVVDSQFENIQVFAMDGTLLMALGDEGRGPGEFWLPAGICVDNTDRIWVADSGNRRVQVFEYIGDER